MPDFDVVQTQRAARSFLPDDVDDETVARILTAATHAPSAENSQPFVFVVRCTTAPPAGSPAHPWATCPSPSDRRAGNRCRSRRT
jgi:Nitroreductase family